MADVVEVKLDTTKLDSIQRQLAAGLVQTKVRQHGMQLNARMRVKLYQVVNRRTGHTGESVTTEYKVIPGGLEANVGPDSEVGAWIEIGTEEHDITPKNKKALYWEGAEHPVKRVHHPGTKPRPFMRPSLDVEGPLFSDDLRDTIARLA